MRGTTIGRKSGRVHLLAISSEQPVAETLWRACDWSTGITIGANLFPYQTIEVPERHQSTDLSDNQLSVVVPWAPGSPLAAFLPGSPHRRLFLTEWEVDVTPAGVVGTPRHVWDGEIVDHQYAGPKMQILVGGPCEVFSRQIPADEFGTSCNTHLGTVRCGVVLADWTVTAAVVSSTGPVLVVGSATRPGGAMTPLQAADALQLGCMDWIEGGVAKSCGIYGSTYGGGNYTLQLREAINLAPGTSVTITPGCDLQNSGGCVRDSGVFRGCPNIPARAPQFKIPQQTQTAGKK